ncbi:hypothetical protein GCM10009429_11980 [Dyella marensis]
MGEMRVVAFVHIKRQRECVGQIPWMSLQRQAPQLLHALSFAHRLYASPSPSGDPKVVPVGERGWGEGSGGAQK